MLRGTPSQLQRAPMTVGLTGNSGLRECMSSGGLKRTPVSRGLQGQELGGWEGCPPGPHLPTQPLSKAKASRPGSEPAPLCKGAGVTLTAPPAG